MRIYAAALVVLVGLCGAPAAAADLPTKKPAPAPVPEPVIPSSWHFEITGYGWASSIAGSAGFGSLPTLPYYASFRQSARALSRRVHGQRGRPQRHVHRRNRFRLGANRRVRNPYETRTVALYGGKTDLTLNEAFITAFGGVRVPLGVPNLDLYGTVGARNFYSGTKLTVTGPFALFSGTESVNKDWIMPVAGFAAQYRYDDRWFMNVLADLGGWSDSATGQALASVGYNWTKNIATTLGYRVMYTYTNQDTGFNEVTFQPRSFRYRQWMYGPFAGFKYSF